MPIDASATRAAGGEACVGAVVAAGGKIVQLEVQGVVDQLDGLARAQILEKPSSWTSESEKYVRKLIFSKCVDYSKKYDA